MAEIPQTWFDEVIDRREVPALKPHRIVLGEGGERLFPAGVADMDFRAPPCVLQALQHRLDHGVFGYETLPDGLIGALTAWLEARHGWQVDTEHILRAPNVLNSLAVAASLFTEEGDGIIVQPPVFFDFYDIIRENRRRLVPNPLRLTQGRYEMDFDDLERVAAQPNVKMLFLCNPHNPVGRIWSQSELTRLGEICVQHEVLVVSDEIHGDITLNGQSYTPFGILDPAFPKSSITLLSPAKSFNIAACCSAFTVVADPVRRAAFQAENSRLTVNKNNAFANVAMEAAYRHGGPWLDAALAYISGNVDLVRRCLAGWPEIFLIEPEGTFLLWLDFRRLGLSPEALTVFLREEAGWAVTRGQAFGTEGEGFARVNVACRRHVLEIALNRLTAALENRKR